MFCPSKKLTYLACLKMIFLFARGGDMLGPWRVKVILDKWKSMMHIFMILVHMWPLEMFLFSGKWDFKRTLMSMNVYDSWLYFHVLSFTAHGWLGFLIAAKQGLLENGFLLQSTFLALGTLIWPPLSISSYGLLPPYRTWSSKHWRATGHISASNVCVWNTYDSIGSANKTKGWQRKPSFAPVGFDRCLWA